MIGRSGCILALLVATASAAQAQSSAVPSAAPSTGAVGFSSRAHVTVSFPMRGTAMTAGARISVAQRDQLTRVDVLSIEASILPAQIPRIALLIDRRANSVTIWNDTSHLYFTQAFLPQSLGGPERRATPVPDAPARPARSALADLDLLTFDMRLTGHSTTAGIATSGLAVDMKARKHGSASIIHANGTLQVADDFAFFPVSLEAHVDANGFSAPAVVSYAVDAFDRTVPPAESFAIPDGYTRASSLVAVFLGAPRRRPAALPAPSATPSP